MRLILTSGGGLEEPMIPTTNGASMSKRKTADDSDVFSKPPKKPKTDTAKAPLVNLKRKLPGEESIGGLVIMRGPPMRPHSSQDTQRPSSSRTASSEAGRARSVEPSAAKPPSISRSAVPVFTRTKSKGKEREVPAEGVAESDTEEAIRQMNSEADGLRDRSRASLANMTPAALKVEFKFPPPKPSTSHPPGGSRVRQLKTQALTSAGGSAFGTPPSRPTMRDSTMPLVEQETPQIMKNKIMRGEHPSMQKNMTASSAAPVESNRLPRSNLDVGSNANGEHMGHSRRRSSMSMRGKRTSATFESTGIITRPHTSVSDTSLYKHIDPDLPESQRVRQLLIWVASRAMDRPASSSSSTDARSRKSISTKNPPDPQLPPLPPGGAEFMRQVKEDIIKQLAEKRIDTNAYSGPSEPNGSAWRLRENEQNVRNRAREKLFTEQIEERKKEDTAWTEVVQYYNTHQQNVMSSLQSQRRTPMSGKAKGKQRALSQEPDDLEPWENELPSEFRGPNGYDVAKQLVADGLGGVRRGNPRRQELQYKEDRLHAAVSVAHQLTQITASELDHRFSLLSISLTQRTLPPADPSLTTNPSALSNFVPITTLPSARNPGPDPQDLLRAISRTDAARPRSQLGDAARRAAKDVQRVNETQAGESSLAERKLTDVPPTPRKPPGTPKRSSTPGRRG